MAWSVRTALPAAFLLCAGTDALPQSIMQKPQLEEIASGKTPVLDLSYALSDNWLPGRATARRSKQK
jgi:hypothetical protein